MNALFAMGRGPVIVRGTTQWQGHHAMGRGTTQWQGSSRHTAVRRAPAGVRSRDRVPKQRQQLLPNLPRLRPVQVYIHNIYTTAEMTARYLLWVPCYLRPVQVHHGPEPRQRRLHSDKVMEDSQ